MPGPTDSLADAVVRPLTTMRALMASACTESPRPQRSLDEGMDPGEARHNRCVDATHAPWPPAIAFGTAPCLSGLPE